MAVGPSCELRRRIEMDVLGECRGSELFQLAPHRLKALIDLGLRERPGYGENVRAAALERLSDCGPQLTSCLQLLNAFGRAQGCSFVLKHDSACWQIARPCGASVPGNFPIDTTVGGIDLARDMQP